MGVSCNVLPPFRRKTAVVSVCIRREGKVPRLPCRLPLSVFAAANGKRHGKVPRAANTRGEYTRCVFANTHRVYSPRVFAARGTLPCRLPFAAANTLNGKRHGKRGTLPSRRIHTETTAVLRRKGGNTLHDTPTLACSPVDDGITEPGDHSSVPVRSRGAPPSRVRYFLAASSRRPAIRAPMRSGIRKL